MLGLVLSHRANPDIPKPGPVAAAPEPQKSADPAPPKLPAAIPTAPAFVLVDSEPAPPITAADFKPQLDFKGFQMKPQDGPTEADPPANEPYELTLRLEKGDTIEKMLADIDVPEAERKQVAEKLQSLLKKRKLAIGETIELQMQPLPDQPDTSRVLSLSVRPQPEREYLVTRKDDGSYEAEEKTYKVSPRIVRVEGERSGSLQQSGVKAGAPSAAMLEFIRALSYDVDFQRELKEGQKFTVLLEQLVTSDGMVTHPGRFLAGELRLMKRSVTVIRFRPQGGAEGFYNPQGESVVRSFLRTPMDASRITSRFGMREHPILGFSALHAGVDFGAPSGTPILAAGSGKVVMAGANGGYGLYVKLQHTQDVATAYAHMSRIGPGIKPGVAVRQGQVIGFVGSTGMSTGPHLHYEFHRGGKQVNPLAQKFAMRGTVSGKDAARFQALARQYLAQMKNAPVAAEVAKKSAQKKTTQSPKDSASSQIAKGD
ncbi:MAG: peptidoglycan DD-metalloendopeptidase family protein [Reyranella sp.]|jgi:murein DD-endopeptidase MepM/ murein hydrolase activator NlpD|uniref:M23 family metallopeptidase n=1 Tax=Reyranella sp. TaxID=1929291 RepID=UPI0025EAF55B|nr:peptidoglycan DD-metalloendopeptidase family protein [Reyranella sp.]MBR2816304.1 peptidoglycan DD-metalloendopeptidase family protein [Reyranella sp.]